MSDATPSSNLQIRALDDAVDAWQEHCDCGCTACRHLYRVLGELKRASQSETTCLHPAKDLYYHGAVSGRLGDFRCNNCNEVLQLPFQTASGARSTDICPGKCMPFCASLVGGLCNCHLLCMEKRLAEKARGDHG